VVEGAAEVVSVGLADGAEKPREGSAPVRRLTQGLDHQVGDVVRAAHGGRAAGTVQPADPVAARSQMGFSLGWHIIAAGPRRCG
jgi:hypothetical protein